MRDESARRCGDSPSRDVYVANRKWCPDRSEFGVLGKRKITVTPVFLPDRHFTPENRQRRFRQTLHTKFAEWIISDARGETNAAAKREYWWARIAEELPRVIAKPSARCSLSGFKDRRKTVQNQITIKFPQNAYVKTLHWSSLPLSTLFLSERLLHAAKIFPHNAVRGIAARPIRRSASNRERQALPKERSVAAAKASPAKSRITAADARFWAQRSGPGVNCQLIVFSEPHKAPIAEADGGGVRASSSNLRAACGRRGGITYGNLGDNSASSRLILTRSVRRPAL